MLQEVLQFAKHPVYENDENTDLGYRLGILAKLVLWSLVISFTLSAVVGLLENALDLNFGKHATEDLIDNYSTLSIVLLIVIAAPFLEELIFRGPLYWFRNMPSFRLVLYVSVLLFGAIHLFNFEDYSTHWWMAPFLVAPQISMGMFASFIRVRFGLLWSMALHAGYNLALAMPLVLVDLLNINLE